MPAEWSSIPTAMLSFLPRSTWPMNAAMARGRRATTPPRRQAAEPLGERVVHPEAALEVDLARGVAAGLQRLGNSDLS